jgi:hypothetical protein
MMQMVMNAVAQQAIEFVATEVQNDDDYRRAQVKLKFDAPLEWKESEIQSPALLKLRDSLKIDLGGVLIFASPYSSGKSFVLKDLTLLLKRSGTNVLYIDGGLSAGYTSATEFLYTSLGLTKEAAKQYLGPLLPVSSTAGEVKTTIIIDHFEDLMHFFDVSVLIRSWARQTYEKTEFRVMICLSSESDVLKVIDWNGGVKIR